DLGHGQAADHAQRQRDAGLYRQGRVTAGEDEPEPLVIDDAQRLGRVVVHQLSLLLLVVALALAPDPVDGLAAGGGGQPGAGAGGHAVGRPPLHGGRERLGRRFLGGVEVTEAPGQGGDDARPLLAVRPADRGPGPSPGAGVTHSPRASTAVAVLGDPRPPAKTQWPSAWSRSLNVSMAAISAGVARPGWSWT